METAPCSLTVFVSREDIQKHWFSETSQSNIGFSFVNIKVFYLWGRTCSCSLPPSLRKAYFLLSLIGFSKRIRFPFSIPDACDTALYKKPLADVVLVFFCHINPVGGLTARDFEKLLSSHESPQMQLKWLLASGKRPLNSNTSI